MILSMIIIIRYVSIMLMVLNVFKNYRMLIIITILNMITLMNWPNTINNISILNLNIIIGYKISINYNYIGIYMSFVLDLLIWISIIYEKYYISNKNQYNILLLYIVNNLFFSSNDMISLSILYEMQNIPLLLIINNIYNKITLYNKKGIGISNVLLILYGLISGLLLYNSLYYIYLLTNNNNILYNILLLQNSVQSNSYMIYIIICLFISGGIKLSIFPFHIWLGKVHVEAPTIGSIILAGIALKTGFYLHYLFISFFVYISNEIVYVMLYIILIGVIINNLNIFYQIDMKRWIALYSIVHMNLYYCLLFLVIYNINYMNDINYILMVIVLIYGMIGHSLISGGLFLIIGYIYDITHNKNVISVNNNVVSSYIYVILFLLLIANSSFPFFILFVYELLSFTISSNHNISMCILLLILSFSNLLSSLYIMYKYMMTNYWNSILSFTSLDIILVIISIPLLIFILYVSLNTFSLPFSLQLSWIIYTDLSYTTDAIASSLFPFSFEEILKDFFDLNQWLGSGSLYRKLLPDPRKTLSPSGCQASLWIHPSL